MSVEATSPTHAIPNPGTVVDGKYVVERVVGTGGMGVVLAARHLQLKHPVAIKVLAAVDEVSPEATERLLREAQLAAGLTSEHVVRVFDVGVLEDGSPFLVMELLVGEDLRQMLQRRGKLPVQEALELLQQTCDAVSDAHAAGIVHRDLKPSNVFVTRRRDGRAVAKVLDFGISKVMKAEGAEATLTATHSMVGSPLYMSPEQLRDPTRVDQRTDLWALGMLLYELLTGEPAFRGQTLPAVAMAIAGETPEPISSRRTDVPPEVDRIVQRCLEKDPSQRYPTARALLADLERVARALATAHLTVTARASRPPPAPPSAGLPEGAVTTPSAAPACFGKSEPRATPAQRSAPPRITLAPEPMRLQESPFRAKGATMVGCFEYAERSVPGGSPAVIAALPRELQEWAHQVFLPISWYDALRIVDLSEAMARVQGLDLHESVRRRSRFVATRDITGLYRLLLRVVSPELVVERLQRASLRYFDFGRVVVLDTARGISRARFEGLPRRLYPWFVPMLEGYGAVLLESAGAHDPRTVVTAVTPAGQQLGFPLIAVEVELRWS